jgi:hypothetical protein
MSSDPTLGRLAFDEALVDYPDRHNQPITMGGRSISLL